MPKEITRINKTTKWSNRAKKVGIYCRVNDKYNTEFHGIANQASGLIQFVRSQPFADKDLYMEVADIFIDVASGASVIGRPEFQRMLQSVRDGRINYVVTKAVSRFGRST